MFQQAGRGYDMAITQFSPEGRLFQVEYAIEAVRRGTTAIVCKNKNSVVFAVEKKSSELALIIGSEKIFKIDDHIGLVSYAIHNLFVKFEIHGRGSCFRIPNMDMHHTRPGFLRIKRTFGDLLRCNG